MELEIITEANWPQYIRWDELAARALEAFEMVVPEFADRNLSVSVLLANDVQLQKLNHQWRGKDKPTNILSFPMLEPDVVPDYWDEEMRTLPFGDLALAIETCQREAQEKDITLDRHVTHLIVHGLLHLAGYDHETSSREAREMELLEIKALALMGIADPYGDHDQ